MAIKPITTIYKPSLCTRIARAFAKLFAIITSIFQRHQPLPKAQVLDQKTFEDKIVEQIYQTPNLKQRHQAIVQILKQAGQPYPERGINHTLYKNLVLACQNLG
jgi:hypothetical protein